uniref:C2 domain-containing protein n=1 Tax=Rhizophagus irregularis (strain DAOM 181602 / DAOM 197198 / MUCL 43194) TaxID=747089 RepID=U9TKX4_RHIID
MTSFPEDYFYLKVGSTSLVLDVERATTFFGFGGSSVKEGSKTVIASQKSEAENDAAYQLWRHENGYLVNKQTNLYLEVDNGKPGNRIVLHHQKPGSNGSNQRWALTKEGYISLKSHPKYVIDVKGGNAKEGSHVVLSDSGSKSFIKSNSAKWEIVSLSKKRRNEGAIGIIRLELVEAKGLKSVDSFFAGGKSDPYVRVFHEGGQDIIAQTKFIDNNLDPVWNEVHYLPVNNIGDKFILDVMDFNAFTKDKPLGHCTFEVTKELVKEVSPNVFEGTPNGIDKWANLSIQGKLHYKAKFSPLTLSSLPKPTPDFLANLKEKPFDKSTLYVLITLQAPNGSFPPSDTLANLFGYSSTNELFELYKNHVHDDRVVNNTNKTIWTTSMVLWFLRYLLKEHRSEWGGIYERSERYITKELGGDLEIEEIVIAGGRKAVRERFEIKVVDDKQIITRENVKTHDVTRIIRHQTSTGAFQASDELAKLMSFNSSGQLRTALTRHINSQSKSAKITNYETQVWVTILVLYYFRLVGVDHKTEWEESYLRAYKWLWVQFKGKEKIEQEAFKIIESFVKERYSVKEDVMQLDEQFIKHIADKIDFIKKGGVSVSRGISAKKLHGVARIHIVSAKNLMKADSWFGGGASDPYVKIIGLSSGEVYGETRVVYNNINPEWNQVFYIPIYDLNDKIKIQIYDYNAFFKHVTLGSYVLDLKDFVKVLSNGAVTGKN